ncbi:MAG TPA: type II secretion system F family protein [Aeromonadales bacterium]|nr:type II secretion system F family protein [Aeromonadales bacterium]
MAVSTVKKPVAKSRAATRKKVNAQKHHHFTWEGLDRRGAKVSGEIQAANPALVKAQLRKQGIRPGKVRKKGIELFKSKGKPITPADVALIARQLATMMKAGVPLVQSLEIIGQGNEKATVQQLVLEIKNDVESGNNLADALRKHPRYFDDLFCDLVGAGEQSGALETMLDRIALYKEKSEALKSKIKKALTYPIAVLIVAGIVTTILLIYVVPMFESMFKDFGADLPAFTQFVVGLSNSMQENWWIFLGFVIAAVVANKEFHHRSEKYRDFKDRLILKLPILSDILNKGAVARYARTLATTFAAGVPLVEALESAAGASGNVVYRNAINKVRDDVSTGMQMNLSMQSTNIFPNMVVQMVAIGEESGALDSMLSKVAEIYEQEVDDAVDGLSALIEPIIMSILGVVVGGLIIAMYLPIFQMGSVV